jgi:flagellar hook protein FlgE
MNLHGVLRAGVSGMNASSTKAGTIADETASAEFSKLIRESNANVQSLDAVATNVRAAITQGSLAREKSLTDFGVQGTGKVSDPNDDTFLFRTGSFSTDPAADTPIAGNGYMPLGRPLDAGDSTTVLKGSGDENLKDVPPTAGGSMPLGRPLGDGNPKRS